MRLRIIGTLVLAILIIVLMIWVSNPREIGERLIGIDVNLLLLVIVLYLINLLTKSYRWHLLLTSTGNRVPFKNTFQCYIIGLSINNITPGKIAGDPVRLYLLKKDKNVPVGQGLASIFSEKVMDIIVITTMALIGIVFILPLLPVGEAWLLIGILILLIAAIAASLYLFSHTKVLKKVIDKMVRGSMLFSKNGKIKQWGDMFSGFMDKFSFGMKELLKARGSALASMMLTLVIWINEAVRLFIIMMALPGDMEVGLGAVFIASSIANILSMIIPLGSGNILGIGAVFVAVGLDSTTASAAGILHMATSLWLSVPIGVLALMITGFKLSELDRSVD